MKKRKTRPLGKPNGICYDCGAPTQSLFCAPCIHDRRCTGSRMPPRMPYPIADKGFAGHMLAMAGDRREDCALYTALCLNGASKFGKDAHCSDTCPHFKAIDPRREREHTAQQRRYIWSNA